jgi:hypothetical protein
VTDSNLTGPALARPTAAPDAAAFGVDLLLVALFVLAGRTSHHKEQLLAGWAGAAWPFLSGALVGWAAVLVLRRSGRRLPGRSFAVAGVVVTASVIGGMTLRRAFTDGGTPVSFLIVATTLLSIFLFGWRALDRLRRSRRA